MNKKRNFKAIVSALVIISTLLVVLVAPTSASATNLDLTYTQNGEPFGNLKQVATNPMKYKLYALQSSRLSIQINDYRYKLTELGPLFQKDPTLTFYTIELAIQQAGIQGTPVGEQLSANYLGDAYSIVVVNLNSKGVTTTNDVTNVHVDGMVATRYHVDAQGNLGIEVSKKPTSITLTVKGESITITDIRVAS